MLDLPFMLFITALDKPTFIHLSWMIWNDLPFLPKNYENRRYYIISHIKWVYLNSPTSTLNFATTVFSSGGTDVPFFTVKCFIGIIGHGLCPRTLIQIADILALQCIWTNNSVHRKMLIRSRIERRILIGYSYSAC